MTVHDEIRAAGGRVIACDMAGIDASDPAGEMMLTQMLSFSRYQWRKLAERWDMSRRDAIKAGKAMACPFGYRFTDPTPRAHGKGIVDSRLLPDEQAAPIAHELFERKAAGATWLELARWLDHAAPLPNGRYWARGTVGGMIGRRTYLGEARHGEHVNATAHEPIVSPALWRRAQNPPGRRTPRGNYLLSGMVRCAGCGRNMRASSGGTKKPAVYVCTTPECKLRWTTVVVDKIDAEVIAQFFARLDAFHAQAVADDELAGGRAKVQNLEDELTALVQLKVSHPMALAAHQEAVSDLEGRLQLAEDQLAELLSVNAQSGHDARELRIDWPSLGMDERREILRAGIDAILVRRSFKTGAGSIMSKRIRILFRGEAPADLLRRRGEVRSWAWADEPGSLRAAA
jgi:hypothetical protein